MIARHYCLVAIALLSVCLSTRAEEKTSQPAWTQFQGPWMAAAQANRLPLTWSPTQNLLWDVELTGYGQSSPVVWQQQVYITSISGANKENCHICAFDLRSGKPLWQYDLSAATQAENSNYISKAAPTPVADEQGIICFFEGGNLLALDHAGKVRWERNLVEEFGAIESRHGLAASLEQSGDLVFAWVERQTEPYVLGIDKQTGKDVWKAPGVGATSWASPRLVPVDEAEHLVLSAIGSLVGLAPLTGKQLWRMEGITGNSTPTPVPVDSGKFLMGATVGREAEDTGQASESNGLIVIRKGEADKYAADYVWRAKRATSSFGSPIAYQGSAYFVNRTGVLFCLDLATGEERYNARLTESLWATPFLLGEHLCFPGKDGTITLIATGDKFEKVAENRVWSAEPVAPGSADAPRAPGGGSVLYSAIAIDNCLLLRRGDRLYCVRQETR